MWSVSVTSEVNQAALQEELGGESGLVGRYGGAMAGQMTQRARELAPFKTGELKGSIFTRLDRSGDELGWLITATAGHAEYQEVGFTHWGSGQWIEGKHFMERAGDEVFGRFF